MTTDKQPASMPDVIYAYHYDLEDQIVCCSVKQSHNTKAVYDLRNPKVSALPEWLQTLDYQRDLALIWMVAKQSKDYDESVGDRIERVQTLILGLKKPTAQSDREKELDKKYQDRLKDILLVADILYPVILRMSEQHEETGDSVKATGTDIYNMLNVLAFIRNNAKELKA